MAYDILIKFGERAHMEELIHQGVVYMNTLEWYRTQENNAERHDPDEGLERIMQAKGARLYRKDPETGKSKEIAELTGGAARVWHSNLDRCKVFCLFHFTAPDDTKLELGEVVSKRTQSGFGDTAVVIYDVAGFVPQVKTAAHEQGFFHSRKFVQYVDMGTYSGEIGPFVKDLRFRHQQELRIAVLDKYMSPEPVRLRVGSLENMALLIPADEIHKIAMESQLIYSDT
ncbi:MAG: hypothetical protein IT488_05120 [Gammaproteobacteria bacterium]|nr:hypothetical protein [Gammaproteobacteria bacterium]